MYKSITIKAGSGGWGGPLTITYRKMPQNLKCYRWRNYTGSTEDCRYDWSRSCRWIQDRMPG